jgi:hypothetical protein
MEVNDAKLLQKTMHMNAFFLAVFALMFFYWKYLDMFQTIRYLALISIPLFLFGHRVLAVLAARR